MQTAANVGDVYVVGAGLPELAAALELAEVGLSVRVGIPEAESSSAATEVRPGAPDEAAAQLGIDPPAAQGGDTRGVADRDGALDAFLRHVASPLDTAGTAVAGALPVASPPPMVLLRTAKGGWAPQPTPTVLGIPAVPLSSRVLEILGGGGATRAYLDRIKPVLTIGKTNGLGELVRARLGAATLRLLVEPFVRQRFGVAPDAVEVAVAAPGLNEALTRVGSLSGAVLATSERSVARETEVLPAGGWAAFGRTLLERLAWYDVSFDAAPVRALRRDEEAWTVHSGDEPLSVRAVVLGLDATRAVLQPEWTAGLVEEHPNGAESHAEIPRRRAFVSLAIEDPGVPSASPPARTVALQSVDVPIDVPGGGRWSVAFVRSVDGAWSAEAIGPATAAALAPAGDLVRAAQIAVEVGGGRVQTGAAAVSVRIAPHVSTEERATAEARLETQRQEHPGLLAVGAGLHGDDLAAAIADARQAAVQLRRRLTGIA